MSGMCHLPGFIFHFQKSRTGPEFLNFFPEQVKLFKFYSRIGSSFDNLISNVKMPVVFLKITDPITILFQRKCAYLLAKDTECLPVSLTLFHMARVDSALLQIASVRDAAEPRNLVTSPKI